MMIKRLVVGELDTNCYVVASQDKNAFIVDPGDDAQVIGSFLKEHDLTGRFIINTHGHIDHIKANFDLGLDVYIHSRDARLISDPGSNPMTFFFGGFQPVVPSRLLEEGDLCVLDELSFKVLHTPGHTAGCICLSGEGVLFSGDTLFKNGIGRTDFPGASSVQIEESLRKICAYEDEIVVYPGHGSETSLGRECGAWRKKK